MYCFAMVTNCNVPRYGDLEKKRENGSVKFVLSIPVPRT